MGTDDDVNIAFFPSLQCSKVTCSSQEGKAVHLRRPPTWAAWGVGPVTYLDGVMVMGPPDREGMLYLYG